MRNILMTSLFK